MGWTASGHVAPRRLDASTEPSQEHALPSPTALAPAAPARARPQHTFGILSSFPPTECGIATFAAALGAGLVAGGASLRVVRTGGAPPIEDPLVDAALGTGSRAEVDAAVAVLDGCDVAVVQHEYGIFDGPDGEALIPLLEALTVPVVVVAHTVVAGPTPNQHRVLQRVCDLAAAVVVMTTSARTQLIAGYRIDPTSVLVIPHGAATPAAAEAPTPFTGGGPRAPKLLTWGLLGPGKGIEWAIDAMALLSDLRPRPTYTIAGATHPKVLAASGETYRQMLVARAWSTGCAPGVTFDGAYRSLQSLNGLVRSADLVVLPYDSADQVTSGVLVDAVAAGCPVVATAFPHAVELLASGAGLVVPQRDPQGLAEAIRTVVTDPALAAGMAAEARRLAPDLAWGAVASRYVALADRLVAAARPTRLPAGDGRLAR